jgi:hypothetical protein
MFPIGSFSIFQLSGSSSRHIPKYYFTHQLVRLMEELSYSWLFIFYNILGLLMLIQGLIWLFYPAPFYNYLVRICHFEHRPPIFVKTAYSFFFLGTISLIAAFFLRSGADILFGLGLIALSYKLIKYLNHWDWLRTVIPDKPRPIQRFLRQLGLFLLAIALVAVLLLYRLVQSGS